MASTLRTVSIPAFVICALIGAGIVVARFRAAGPSGPSDTPPARSDVSPTRPDARDARYVGSQACAPCHEQLFEQFTASPMGQSMATVADAVQVENFEEGLVKPSLRRHYRVDRDETSVMHREILLDENGVPYWEQSEEVSFVVGSGRRGRSYLINRNGLFFQSPITWYDHGQRWDLSPSYIPEKHPRFSRRIGDGCLYCHAGRMHLHGTTSDRYAEPIFEELAIGCERCHGPGEQHVRLHSDENHSATGAEPLQDPIVNPASLSVSKRESVCNQCHLLGNSVVPRYGRSFFDFRPGDELEDIFVVLSQEIDVKLHGSLKAVNQVEQMRESRCYQASDGRLGCISCHDAHSTPTPEQRVEHYRQRCLTCHETKGCSLDLASRQEPPASNSCIHCHMPALLASDVPHTSFSDHRIPRDPLAMDAGDEPAGVPHVALDVIENAGGRLPWKEIERARGITMMTEARGKGDEYLAASALTHLMQALDSNVDESLATIDDAPLVSNLASGYMLLGDFEKTERCWNRLLELEPNDEKALMGLAKLAEERQDLQALGECLDKFMELNPTSEQAFYLLVKQRHYSGNTAGAIEAAERVLEINPTNAELRSWLAGVYRQQGDADRAREHEEFLSKMGFAKPTAASNSSN